MDNMFDEMNEQLEEKNDISRGWEEKRKKLRVEDTSTRATFLIQNDLISRLDQLAQNEKRSSGTNRGYKTHVVNEALRRALDEIEGK